MALLNVPPRAFWVLRRNLTPVFSTFAAFFVAGLPLGPDFSGIAKIEAAVYSQRTARPTATSRSLPLC